MAKVPKFMQQMLQKNKAISDRTQEKLQGKAIIDMQDPQLQWALGGWIRGRANLIYGPYGSGKTALAMIAAGSEQQLSGGAVIIFDSEWSHSDPWATDENGKATDEALKARTRLGQAGLDWQKVILKQSNEVDTLFEDLEQIKADIKDDPSCISAIIVDSWGGMQGESGKKAIAKGEISRAGNQFGGNARTTKPILQELLRIAAEYSITQFYIQHCIVSLSEYGPKYLLLGGENLKFLVHNILFVEGVQAKDASLLDGDVATTKETVSADVVYRVGKKIRFCADKSRQNVEGRKGEFFMNFETLKFALPEQSLFSLAEKLGVITHPGTPVFESDGITPKVDKNGVQEVKYNKMWWCYPPNAPTPAKFQGEKGTIQALKDDKDLFNRVYQDCLKSGKKDATTVTDESDAVLEASAPKKKGKK